MSTKKDLQITGEFTRKGEVYTPEWGSDTISRLVTPKLHEYFRTYTPHGLVLQTAWLAANVSDEEGNRYNLLRAYYLETTSLVMASQVIPGLDSTPVPVFKPGEMWLGRVSHEMDPAKGEIVIKPLIPIPAEQSFSITVRPQHISWKDVGGRIDLEFKALAPAMEFYTPGQLEDIMYRTEQGYFEGTLNGKRISGWGNLDMSWGTPGVGFTQSKVYRFLEEQWACFLNIFEDGSREGGVLVTGVEGFKVGMYHKDGKARVTRNLSSEIEYTADQFVKGAKIRMDEMEFHFITEARIAKAVAHVTWASGRMINRNDPRKPMKTYCWFEYFPPKG